MRVVPQAILGLALLWCTGCFSARPSAPDSYAHIAARNSVQQSIRLHDDSKFAEHIKKQAEQSLKQCPESSTSKAFQEGYVEGFVDYVEAGGDGEPPYLPPFRYRTTHHRNPEGHQLIQDWYAGFRRGAHVARDSGLRELNLVPLPRDAKVDPVLSSASMPSSRTKDKGVQLPEFELVMPRPLDKPPEPSLPTPKITNGPGPSLPTLPVVEPTKEPIAFAADRDVASATSPDQNTVVRAASIKPPTPEPDQPR